MAAKITDLDPVGTSKMPGQKKNAEPYLVGIVNHDKHSIL